MERQIRYSFQFEEKILEKSSKIISHLHYISNKYQHDGYIALHLRIESAWKEHDLKMMGKKIII